MVGFQNLELCDLNVQIHLFLNKRISSAQCFDLCIGQRLLVHIITGAHRGFGCHDLADESLFILKGLKQVRVKCPLCNVIEHLDFLVHIALPDDSAVALGHVAGLPSNVQVMHCHKPLLDVGSGPHFCRASEQNPHIAGAHFGEQCGFFRFGIGVVDELNFAFRHPGGDQLLANIIVDIEVAIVFWC